MSSLGEETVLVRVPLPAYFLYVAPAVEHVQSVAFEKEMVVLVPLTAYFLCGPGS